MIPTWQNEYFLQSTNDTTDRTQEIREKLDSYGVCILGSGMFYAGGIQMPDGSSLFGMGNATQIMLDPTIEEGYILRMGSFCTVRSLGFCGSHTPIPCPKEVGNRHAILFYGTATPRDWTGNHPVNSIVSDCFMTDFTGGGLTCTDTGYSIRASLTVNNCHMVRCGAGINVSHFSEYHRFSNIHCTENLYGCINNGGNNVFSACLFDANKIGFMIDNSKQQSPNHSHGSVTGCTFNHSDGNHGIGILLMGATNGFLFTGCQCFYSEIVAQDSENIVFSSMNFGARQKITVKGGKKIHFSDCVFAQPPTVTVEGNDKLTFGDCYTAENEPITL